MMGSDQLGYTGFLADIKEPYDLGQSLTRTAAGRLSVLHGLLWFRPDGEAEYQPTGLHLKPEEMLALLTSGRAPWDGLDDGGWPLRDAPEGTV